MVVSSEDFSFPKITNPLPHFVISPSLWRVSSVVYPDDRGEDQEPEVDTKARKSFSSFLEETNNNQDYEEIIKGRASDADHEEEKMDMLWENFNEELQRVSSLNSKKQQESVKLGLDCKIMEQQQQLCCVKALKVSKTGIYHHHQPKRPNMVVVFKILKKMFSLHNSARTKKKNY